MVSNHTFSKRKIFTLLSIYHADSGHPSGPLSIMGILIHLYFEEMSIKSPNDPNRDRFILSKGYACPALYTVLVLKIISF